MNRGGHSRNRGGHNFGRNGRSNGRQATQPRGLFADGIWHCDCTPRLPAEHFKVKKEGKNQGRWFYTCQKSDKGCGFFLWDEDAKPREEAAVLSGKRTEPKRESIQEGWNAGRVREGEQLRGKGLFAQSERPAVGADDASTASPTPPPSYRSVIPATNGVKRTVQTAQLDDDEFGLADMEDDDLVTAVDSSAFETPQKAQKTGVYATPATTTKRKLPWLEPPTTPVPAAKPAENYFDTPSKRPRTARPVVEPETPLAPPTTATDASPSPPTRYKDALVNPADLASSLTSEVLAALSKGKVSIPAETLSNVRTILTRHDLKNQGVIKGRDISRLAIKAKDAKIAELQARIASLEADREVERGLGRMRRWESENRQS
ncbi:hypothetical protein LTR37_002635 [Vermiconidia calcicola]|uniref:Uncharacterized protein n=1 Tax=Vermiconidia calcicola TaxID=1690605 RepID=A0ACC3NTX9_9PEZI|nr:hypothetical protein LTR37_002635 [Vermiconidia calcicola]